MFKTVSLILGLLLLAALLPGCNSPADAFAAPGLARITRTTRNSPPLIHVAQDPTLDEFLYLPLVLRGMTLTLVADRTSITPGQCVTLSWSVQGAVSVTFNGSPVAATGTSIQCPLLTTTYTLAAVDTQGVWKTTSLTIAVTSGY